MTIGVVYYIKDPHVLSHAAKHLRDSSTHAVSVLIGGDTIHTVVVNNSEPVNSCKRLDKLEHTNSLTIHSSGGLNYLMFSRTSVDGNDALIRISGCAKYIIALIRLRMTEGDSYDAACCKSKHEATCSLAGCTNFFVFPPCCCTFNGYHPGAGRFCLPGQCPTACFLPGENTVKNVSAVGLQTYITNFIIRNAQRMGPLSVTEAVIDMGLSHIDFETSNGAAECTAFPPASLPTPTYFPSDFFTVIAPATREQWNWLATSLVTTAVISNDVTQAAVHMYNNWKTRMGFYCNTLQRNNCFGDVLKGWTNESAILIDDTEYVLCSPG